MKKILVFIILAGFFSPFLGAQNTGTVPGDRTVQGDRTVPLDLYLVIDSSSAFSGSINNAIKWVNDEVIGQILREGDSLVVWAAGDRGEMIFSGTISSGDLGGNTDLRNRLSALEASGRRADFISPLRDISIRTSQTQVPRSRLGLTMLVFSSAAVLEPVLRDDTRSMLRWSRTLRYEGWQVIMTAADIGPRVQQAARVYMSSLQ